MKIIERTSLILVSLLLIGIFRIPLNSGEPAVTQDVIVPATLIVDQSGSGDYLTITEAIENATSGDTIFIRPGDFFEEFSIEKPLKIIGDENGPVRIFLTNGRVHFELLGSNITLENVILNGSYSIESSNFGIALGGNDTIIHNCVIEEYDTGIIDIGGIWGKIRNTYIDSNSFTKMERCIGFSLADFTYISNCTFFDSERGIVLGPDEDTKTTILINNSSFDRVDVSINTGHLSDDKRNVNVRDCFINQDSEKTFNTGIIGFGNFRNNQISNVQVGIDAYGGSSITDNVVRNCSKTGIRTRGEWWGPIDVTGNTIMNSTIGVEVRNKLNTVFTSNDLIDCGFYYNNMNYTYAESISMVGNTVDGKEVLFLNEGNEVRLDSDRYGQVFLKECDDFSITGIERNYSTGYSYIQIGASTGGVISDCYFGGSDPSISLDGCSNVNVIDNWIMDGESGIVLQGSHDVEIARNRFYIPNGSFFDDGPNLWDDGSWGNSWESMDLPDDLRDGISETIVRIPGGSSVDNFPLVPSILMDTEIQGDLENGKDGSFLFQAVDFNIDMLRNATAFIGTEEIGFFQYSLDKDLSTTQVDHPIPLDLNTDIEVWINATDIFGEYHESRHEFFTVHDTTGPEIVIDSIPESVRWGDLIRINITASDNIGIDSLWARYSNITNTLGVEVFEKFGDIWSITIGTERLDPGRIMVQIFGNDTSDNKINTSFLFIDVINMTAPELIDVMGPETVFTGDDYSLGVVISRDPITMENITLNWNQDGISHIIPLEYSDHFIFSNGTYLSINNYKTPLSAERNSISEIVYYFEMVDIYGNVLITDTYSIEVKDDIWPYISEEGFPDEIGTGETFYLNFSVSDNIGIDHFWASFTVNDVEAANFTGEDRIEWVVPENETGHVRFRVFAQDVTGLQMMLHSSEIDLVDTIDPEFIGYDIITDAKVGSYVIIKLNARDNIGISSIEWNVEGISNSNDTVVFKPTVAGETKIQVEFSDARGNTGQTEITITVEEVVDEDDQRDEGNYLMWIGLGIIVLVIIIVVILLIARRKKDTTEEE